MNSNFDLAPAQWVTLRRLLDEALDRPPAERTTWVDALAPDYEALKPRLHALLAFDVRGTSALPLDSLPRIETAQFLADRRTEADGLHAGGKVGPYRLVRLLGEGGMGEVWLAERTDMLHKRQVALKLPRLLTGRAALAERMAREREILAGLDHPNIARLYDAGVTADGQPYLALEYVEGERIDAYCARGQLDVPARLRLFLQVARAVAHAHANLVVHRDLKPTNILVTAAGDVKLLDFGIAKLLEDGRAAETELTQLAGRALTPDYAAPEQILGQPIGTAADVYALGVVLFELLTGTRPYQLKRESRAALEEAIVQAEPARPSSVVAEPKLRTQLRGDLDTIVLKALKKAPAERYPMVLALAEDIERHLACRPVRARPDSRGYRLRKFLERNTLEVGATAAVMTAIIVGAGTAVWQGREAQIQRDSALQQQRRAEATNEFMNLLLDSTGRDGKPVTMGELLDRGVAMLEARADSDPRLVGNLYFDVSRRYATLGAVDRELDILQRSIDAARNAGDEELLAASNCATALALLARDGSAARARLAEADAALSRRGAADAGTEATCARARSQIQQADGNPEQAIATLRSSLQKVQRSPSPLPGLQIPLMGELGDLYFKTDRIAESLQITEAALDLYERSGRGATMGRVITTMNYAAILSRSGEVVAAAEAQRHALEIARSFDRGRELPIGFAGHLGSSLLRLGRLEEARDLFTEDLARARAGGNSRFAASTELMLGRALARLKHFDEAEQHLQSAESALSINRGGNARLLNELALTRASIYLDTGQLQEAERIVRAVLGDLSYPARKNAAGLGSALYTAARAALARNDAVTAETYATDCLGIVTAIARDARRSADVGQARLLRAEARRRQGQHAAALDDAAAAVAALEVGFGAMHPEAREAQTLLAALSTGQAAAAGTR